MGYQKKRKDALKMQKRIDHFGGDRCLEAYLKGSRKTDLICCFQNGDHVFGRIFDVGEKDSNKVYFANCARAEEFANEVGAKFVWD